MVEQILQQSTICSADVLSSQFAAKQQVINNRSQFLSDTYDSLLSSLPSKLHAPFCSPVRKAPRLSWLTALPLADQGFALHKGAFRDALCLRYGWQPHLLPSHCTCGKTMSIEHALSCPFGGFLSIRHNELRDITAGFLCEVYHNVGIEPSLQPLSGEQFHYRHIQQSPTFRGYVVWRNGKLLNGFLSRKYTISRLSLICVYLHTPTII